MRVFADFHNFDLYHSLQLLFEKRLGHELYRPIGTEWFDKGFWKIAEPYQNNPETIQQFLAVNNVPFDNTPPLNDLASSGNGVYRFEDEVHGSFNKGITFDAFTKNKFDIVIASIPQHIEPYRKLIQEYQPQAKLVFQIGNIWWDKTTDFSNIPNILASVKPFMLPSSCNSVFYHQEFPLEVFHPKNKTLPPRRLLTSFVNNLPQNKLIGTYVILRQLLPEFEFRMYGGGCEDGSVTGIQNIADIMNESLFGVHFKPDGDGFGHILYNWFACGKPVIINGKDYEDKLGGELLIDGETCIDIDRTNPEDLARKVQSIKPLEYEWMCQRSYAVFKEKVDYDKEEVRIREWIDSLV